MNRPHKKSWSVSGYTTKKGVYHPPTTAHRRKELNPRSGPSPSQPAVPLAPTAPMPSTSPSDRSSNKKKTLLTVAATLTVGAVAVTATLSGPGGSGRNLNVRVNANLTQAIGALTKIGFTSASGAKSSGIDCANNATGEVKSFLTQHPCKEFAAATWITARHGTITHVTISWVVMPTFSLATQYKANSDAPGEGNPPGQSPTFTGLCYSSGQDGNTVWAEQVQPTGYPQADQEVLQAAAPESLSASYLIQHCNH
jgi:hypothetical protein